MQQSDEMIQGMKQKWILTCWHSGCVNCLITAKHNGPLQIHAHILLVWMSFVAATLSTTSKIEINIKNCYCLYVVVGRCGPNRCMIRCTGQYGCQEVLVADSWHVRRCWWLLAPLNRHKCWGSQSWCGRPLGQIYKCWVCMYDLTPHHDTCIVDQVCECTMIYSPTTLWSYVRLYPVMSLYLSKVQGSVKTTEA